jgi:hypothetical protein
MAFKTYCVERKNEYLAYFFRAHLWRKYVMIDPQDICGVVDCWFSLTMSVKAGGWRKSHYKLHCSSWIQNEMMNKKLWKWQRIKWNERKSFEIEGELEILIKYGFPNDIWYSTCRLEQYGYGFQHEAYLLSCQERTIGKDKQNKKTWK